MLFAWFSLLRLNLKLQKPVFNQIQTDTHTYITEDKIKLEWANDW